MPFKKRGFLIRKFRPHPVVFFSTLKVMAASHDIGHVTEAGEELEEASVDVIIIIIILQHFSGQLQIYNQSDVHYNTIKVTFKKVKIEMHL